MRGGRAVIASNTSTLKNRNKKKKKQMKLLLLLVFVLFYADAYTRFSKSPKRVDLHEQTCVAMKNLETAMRSEPESRHIDFILNKLGKLFPECGLQKKKKKYIKKHLR